MTERKFHRKVFQVEVLSEEPLGDVSLDQVHYLITDGPCSGDFKEVSSEVLDGKQAADALHKQGSEPGFFRLDDEGNEAPTDEAWAEAWEAAKAKGARS